ncbi:hypothetical protein GQ457_07G015820 [Hibiscus cannabinus]
MGTKGFDGVDFPILSTQPSLERPISPVPKEDQRATKKVKNKGELGVEESQISQAAVGNCSKSPSKICSKPG